MAKDHPKKQCFVIGVIGDDSSPERIHADWLYDEIILPVFDRAGLRDWIVERADRIATPGMVSAQIINRLHDVELVIADLSFHNANAFYELAIRHKVGKPIIHMIRKGDRIRFDVIPHRAVQFAVVHPNDLKEARDKLSGAILEAIKPDFEPDNPITHARGKLEFEQKASPAMKVLADELAALRGRIDNMESTLQRDSSPGLWSGGTLLGTPVLGTPVLGSPVLLRDRFRTTSLINEPEVGKPSSAPQNEPLSSTTKSE
jgi:hypothetical protein